MNPKRRINRKKIKKKKVGIKLEMISAVELY